MFGNKPTTLIGGAGVSSPVSFSFQQQQQTSSRALVEESSQKEIVQMLGKCIQQTKFLTEFSQILHVNNISKINFHFFFFFFYLNSDFNSTIHSILIILKRHAIA